jgi:hypothetical protein
MTRVLVLTGLLFGTGEALGANDDPDNPPDPPDPVAARRAYEQDLQTIRWGTPLPFAASGPVWPDAWFSFPVGRNASAQVSGLIRGQYFNDQRIEWSGLESSFGAEAVLRPSIRTTSGDWALSGQGEFFLNEPRSSSVLHNLYTEIYAANFKIDALQINELFVQAESGDFAVRIGKSRTPFGRYQSPMVTNSLADAPFLRTDVIQFTETGVFFRYQPGGLVIDTAVVNGEPNLDTNSSKGVIGRVGYEGEVLTAGASAKWQDGIGSEYMKRFNNVYGVDAAVRAGRLLVYGEAMYDDHGFVRNFFGFGQPITWPFSMYGRDAFSGTTNKPITGWGYYAGAAYRWDVLTLDASFGSYYPQPIGDPASDTPIHRGLVKLVYSVTGNFQLYAVALVENPRPVPGVQPHPSTYPYAVFTGLQLGF